MSDNIFRNQIIGRLFDELLGDKFTEIIGNPIKENEIIISNKFLFKTPYKGKYDWIKIIIPIDFNDSNILVDFEYQINNNLFINKQMNIYKVFENIKNINDGIITNEINIFKCVSIKEKLIYFINEHNSFSLNENIKTNIQRIEYLYEEIKKIHTNNSEILKNFEINLKCYDYNI